jgi:hypothetical protein
MSLWQLPLGVCKILVRLNPLQLFFWRGFVRGFVKGAASDWDKYGKLKVERKGLSLIHFPPSTFH